MPNSELVTNALPAPKPVLAALGERPSIRCTHCKLMQFESAKKICRRCHKSYATPIVVAVSDLPRYVIDPNAGSPFLTQAVASTLQKLRTKSGHSQRTLAAAINAPRTYISKLENGHATPLIASLYRLVGPLDVTMAEFMHEVERTTIVLAVQHFEGKEKSK